MNAVIKQGKSWSEEQGVLFSAGIVFKWEIANLGDQIHSPISYPSLWFTKCEQILCKLCNIVVLLLFMYYFSTIPK